MDGSFFYGAIMLLTWLACQEAAELPPNYTVSHGGNFVTLLGSYSYEDYQVLAN